MIGPDGALPLPWLEAPLRHALSARGHAFLLQGPGGVGQYEAALSIAQSWLCESPREAFACGQCASCRLVQSHSHPDLLVLMPELLREPLNWPLPGDESPEKDKKRKPSKDIKVDEVKLVIGFAQTTAARGRGKVVVLHPAERMNGVAANSLLKTLEEPPGDARLLLACATPDALLPTIRSRCQVVRLPLPEAEVAADWLATHAIAQPAVLLAAAGGQPQEALAGAQDGMDAAAWTALPKQLQRGQVGALASWPLPRAVEALQKVCHDAMRMAAGAQPRYFDVSAMPPPVPLEALSKWSRELGRVARHAEHPWNGNLMVEALVQQAARALQSSH